MFYRSSHEHIACTGSVDVINRSPDRHRSSPSAVASIRHGDIGHCEQYAAMQLAQTAQVLLGNRQCNTRGSRTGFTKLNTQLLGSRVGIMQRLHVAKAVIIVGNIGHPPQTSAMASEELFDV